MVISRAAHIRSSTVALTAVLALGLTACSDSTSGSGSRAGASSGSTASGSSGSRGSSGAGGGSAKPASTLEELAATLVTGTTAATTVHLTLATSGAGAAAAAGSGEGDIQTADGGKTQAFQFDIGSGATALSMIYVDGTGYVKLPASEQSDPTKPWAKVSDTSSNPVIKALSTAFDQINQQTSLTQYSSLLKGATKFQATGPTSVDGTSAQGYTFEVDPKSLPSSSQFGDAVSQLGPIPTTMAVDSQGRPVRVVEKVTVQSQTITTTVTFSDYGKKVAFSAPPAAQTSTD